MNKRTYVGLDVHARSESGWAGLVDDEDRARQPGIPLGNPGIVGGQALPQDFARFMEYYGNI